MLDAVKKMVANLRDDMMGRLDDLKAQIKQVEDESKERDESLKAKIEQLENKHQIQLDKLEGDCIQLDETKADRKELADALAKMQDMISRINVEPGAPIEIVKEPVGPQISEE